MTRDELKEMLRDGAWTVTFTKTDGTERKMLCTLKAELIPQEEVEGTKRVHKVNEEVLPVWDLEKDAWRSFRVDSVKEIV
jgi:hypothetical protein